MSQLPNHKADHRHIHEGFTGLGQSLVVFGETTLTVQPTKGALHNPPSGQQHKASLTFDSLHNLQLPAQCTLHPCDQFASVCSVRPNKLQAAQAPPVLVARLLDTLKQSLEHTLAPISVL